jgi:acetyl-CoA carboxylase biotin carboxylase subunit
MRRALLDLVIDGVETSREFHLRVMDDEEFTRGEIDIQWLERRLPALLATPPPESLVRDVAIIAALIADRDRTHSGATRTVSQPNMTGAPTESSSAWHRAARADSLR